MVVYLIMSDNNPKRQHQLKILKANNDLADEFVEMVIKRHDNVFRKYDEDYFTCLVCNRQCKRSIKVAHKQSQSHIINMRNLKDEFAKTLNGILK